MSTIKKALRIAKNATPQFKNWFGDSKIVDDAGNPAIVYHGTAARPFKEFHEHRPNFFTPMREYAEGYNEKGGKKSRIIDAHLSINKPFDPSTDEESRRVYNEEFKNYLEKRFPTRVKDFKPLEKGEPLSFIHADLMYPFLRRRAEADPTSYDGMKVNEGGPFGNSWVPLKNTQIKSATKNNGNFDPNDPDITKSSGGIIDTALRIARAEGGEVAHSVKLYVGPIHSRVSGRTDHLPVHVPSSSYVLPADIVSAMGDGNTTAGFEHIKRMFGGLPYHGHGSIPYGGGEGPYGSELPRADGGAVGNPVPCVLAGGEYVLSPEQVHAAGDGDITAGHKALDAFVNQYRAKTIKTLKGLPGPRKD